MKVKLVQIKSNVMTRSDGFVLIENGVLDDHLAFSKVHGYKPKELYWVVDNDFDDSSWIVIKPHRINREGFIAGGISKEHGEIKGIVRTLWGKFELGQNGLDAVKVRVENLERRRINQREQLQKRIEVRNTLLEESRRNYADAVASAENDKKYGRISREPYKDGR